MSRYKKLRILLFLSIAVAAILLLSAGISELELRPGQPFPLWSRPPVQRWGGTIGGGTTLMTLFRVFMALSVILFPIALVYLIISPEARKEFLARLSFFLTLLAFFYLLTRAQMEPLAEQEAERGGMPSEVLPPAVPPVEFIPNPPRWLTLVATVGLALLLSGLVVGILWFIWRQRQRPASPLEQLAQEAQEALDALRAGADVRNTVMRCYLEMARVLSQQRGIRRQRDMTPREFEHRLEDAGLPGEPVRQLTRLFEEVRYGTKAPSENEERQATVCLEAIVEACRSAP